MCTTIKTMLSQLSVATAPQLGIRSAHAPDTIPAKSAVRKNCDTTMTAVTCWEVSFSRETVESVTNSTTR